MKIFHLKVIVGLLLLLNIIQGLIISKIELKRKSKFKQIKNMSKLPKVQLESKTSSPPDRQLSLRVR